MRRPHVMITGGGTGGHIYPGLAIAQQLQQHGMSVSWLGGRRGMEGRVVAAAGLPIDLIHVSPLRGKGLTARLLGVLGLFVSLLQSLRHIIHRRADLVLGMGGYVAGPGGLAARLLGRPLIIHEQNSVLGMTNRILGRIANQMLFGFPNTIPEGKRVVTTGNPVRSEIVALHEPAERYLGHKGPLRLLVFGGSLGAKVLNEMVPCAVGLLPRGQRFEVIHQCGSDKLQATQAAYQSVAVEADVRPFIDDMAALYDWADLVICRAGALTVSELACAGSAALLVPYPYAVDDHQTRNAQFLVSVGAARLLPEKTLDCQRLTGVLEEFSRDNEQGRGMLMKMAHAARRAAITDATQRVAQCCLQTLPESRRGALDE